MRQAMPIAELMRAGFVSEGLPPRFKGRTAGTFPLYSTDISNTDKTDPDVALYRIGERHRAAHLVVDEATVILEIPFTGRPR